MALKSEKSFRSFIKGLITEANELTFPESASVDEANFVLNRDGSRYRRLGVDFEELYTLVDSGFSINEIQEGRQSFHVWESPGGDTTKTAGVVRIKNKLWFMDLLKDVPSSNLLNSGNPITIPLLSNEDIQTAVISNKFVLVSKDIPDPIVLTYNSSTDTVTQNSIDLKIRDLYGVDDGLDDDERPSSLSNEHKYNLRNQGWNENIVTTSGTYTDAIEFCANSAAFGNVYPSNSDSWSLGKNTNPSSGNYEKFDPANLARNSQSRYRVPRGSFVIDLFNRGNSRMSESDVTSGLPTDQENGSISTIASYAQRLFYAGIDSSVTDGDNRSPNYSGYIFFSKVVRSEEDLGKCFQEADPTDPGINDIIASDGGTIQIPDITRIVKIIAGQASLLVFCENGVWEVYGDTGGFTATSFQISKISTNGVLNANSIVNVNGNFIYWSKAGIYSLTPDSASGRFRAESVSLKTIQTLYLNIPELAKDHCKGYYDEKENRVRWLYNDLDTYSTTNFINRYNKELIYDLTLQAFYINTFSILDLDSPYIHDYVHIPGYAITSREEAIYVDTDPVEDSSNEQVIVDSTLEVNRNSQFSYLTLKGNKFTVSKYKDTDFKDWKTSDGTGKYFTSYLITGYEYYGDVIKRKQAPYILFYFKKTENGYTQTGSDLTLNNESSCKVQAQWNWADSANSGRWGTEFQAYKLLRNYIPSGPSDPFDYGDGVIVTKNKLRGYGKTLSLYIHSEDGKDMKLLGWATPVTMTSLA